MTIKKLKERLNEIPENYNIKLVFLVGNDVYYDDFHIKLNNNSQEVLLASDGVLSYV